ncbi:MAG: hypothetical protein HYW48_06125 [Deltaproteobacteria bacterium]|nr:hypothetical protein [Deltaproteobacteria bacterium]
MKIKEQILVLTLSCGLSFVFSCQPEVKKTAPPTSPLEKEQKVGEPTAPTAPQPPKGGASGGGDDPFGGLGALLGGLGRKGGAGGGGAAAAGGPEGAQGGPAGDPSQILPSPRFKTPFLSFQLHLPTKNSMYECPGDSFWVGTQSYYDGTAKDRIYQETCQFFEDGLGRPLKKQNCEIKNASDFEEDFDFTCPKGSLLSGHQTKYSPDKKDRQHSFSCCEAVTEEGKKVDFIEQPVEGTEDVAQICEQSIVARQTSLPQFATRDVNPDHGSVEFKCQNKIDTMQGPMVVGSIVRNVNATYWDNLKDRIFSFECCVLGVTPDTPPANPGN